MTEKGPPERWEELTTEQRSALMEVAKARIFWHQFGQRMGWLKGAATVVLTLAAAIALFRDQLATWLMK